MGLRPPGGRIERGPIPTRAITVKPVEDKIRSTMADRLKTQLGVELTEEMKSAVDVAAAGAAQQVVQLGLAKVAEEASREITKGSLLGRFDEKLGLAAESIGHLGQSNDVDTVLKNRAELLAKKKKALVTAGFSDTEAMEILLADIAARGH